MSTRRHESVLDRTASYVQQSFVPWFGTNKSRTFGHLAVPPRRIGNESFLKQDSDSQPTGWNVIVCASPWRDAVMIYLDIDPIALAVWISIDDLRHEVMPFATFQCLPEPEVRDGLGSARRLYRRGIRVIPAAPQGRDPGGGRLVRLCGHGRVGLDVVLHGSDQTFRHPTLNRSALHDDGRGEQVDEQWLCAGGRRRIVGGHGDPRLIRRGLRVSADREIRQPTTAI